MGLLRFHGGTYTLSWEVYRALAGQPYSGGDKCLDDALDAQTHREVVVQDTQGWIQIKKMPIGLANRFEESRKQRERELLLKTLWEIYDDLFSKYAYHRGVSNNLVELKTTLEKFNA